MGFDTPRDPQQDSRNRPGTASRQYLLDRRTYLSVGAIAMGTALTSGVRAEDTENDAVETYWTDFSEGEL